MKTLNDNSLQERYHVTVLSNLSRAYDKYARRYSKAGLPESTFGDSFYVLGRDELQIGFDKATKLLNKLGLDGNRLIVLQTSVSADELHSNERTGLGQRIDRPFIRLDGVRYIDSRGGLIEVRLEEAMADSLAINRSRDVGFHSLRPRSVSVLPIAIGCQAACPFCFSKASVSADQRRREFDDQRIRAVFQAAKRKGAERAVITGGGEPGLLSQQRLVELIGIARETYDKVVLISNGVKWARMNAVDRLSALLELDQAGLSVMSLSRHHHSTKGNQAIMGLDTASEHVAATWRNHRDQFQNLRLRWVCVLQKQGIESRNDLNSYLNWVETTGVSEVCFKELYVSTSTESEYHNYPANEWSHQNQVSLSLITDAAVERNWIECGRLPWGVPVYDVEERSAPLRVAAYTEPSLNWELENGLCRSWNLMADGRCLASLEDRSSLVMTE